VGVFVGVLDGGAAAYPFGAGDDRLPPPEAPARGRTHSLNASRSPVRSLRVRGRIGLTSRKGIHGTSPYRYPKSPGFGALRGNSYGGTGVDALTLAAASAVVGPMTTQAWEQARQAVVAFWRQRHPEEVPAIDAELVYGQTQAAQALAIGDRAVEAALVGDWQRKLRRLLTADPALAAELQRVLDEELTPLLPVAEAARITKIRMSANVSDHGRVYMSGGKMTINEGPS